MRRSIGKYYLIVVYIGMILAGCATVKQPGKTTGEGVAAQPNYAEESSWLVKPSSIDTAVDVFYVYPTIYNEKQPGNMDITRADLKARAMNCIVSQASVFNDSANLFAPLYRQMTLAELDPEADMYENQTFRIGVEDVERAFDYYLDTLNPDRPFILAGHSQGTMVLLDIMRRRFNDTALQKRLVAAYLIGYSLTQEDLERYPWMKLAQKADDTGVIITYNTQSPTATGSPVLLRGAQCINPLNWTTGPASADKSLNLGAVFFDNKTNKIKREVPYYSGAQIDEKNGALITTPPEPIAAGSFPAGVYHEYDYAFWYRNLQKNVTTRIRAYKAKH